MKTLYFSHNEPYASQQEALDDSMYELAKTGLMVEIATKRVPKCACSLCKKPLLDWQTKVGYEAGDKDDSECYLFNGIAICIKCAEHLAMEFVHEQKFTYEELCANEKLCHLAGGNE